MKQLEIQAIDLVADHAAAAGEEEKISSSSTRKRLLGTLLRPPIKVSCAIESIISQETRCSCRKSFMIVNVRLHDSTTISDGTATRLGHF